MGSHRLSTIGHIVWLVGKSYTINTLFIHFVIKTFNQSNKLISHFFLSSYPYAFIYAFLSV